MTKPPYRKKLIEVALPLEAINEGSKSETENPFLKGHPRAIHNWWARTPLSVARAIIFAQLMDDPSNDYPPNEAAEKRDALLNVVSRLATWEATKDCELLEHARALLSSQFDGQTQEFWDMFAGRGSIPLEAQRLGLKVTASDLNPVAVLISRTLMDYPIRFSAHRPVNPDLSTTRNRQWKNHEGLIEDLLSFGRIITDRAKGRLSSYYPRSPGGHPVFAWLWTRTVPSPDPAQKGAFVPLARTFWLSKKEKRRACINPIIDKALNKITYEICCEGDSEAFNPVQPTAGRKGARCLLSGAPMPLPYVRAEAKAGRMNVQLMAIVAKGDKGCIYYPPSQDHENVALSAVPLWKPDSELPKKHRNFQPPVYGMNNVGDLFTSRQLLALDTLAQLINEMQQEITLLAKRNGDFIDDDKHLHEGGKGATAYAEALTTYLSMALSRLTDYSCSLSTWNPSNENVRNLFQRQAIPMAWDFAEVNIVEGKLSFATAVEWVVSALDNIPVDCIQARAEQIDACSQSLEFNQPPIISTDPPYYDNISYADLCDFFYPWLRRCLRHIHPTLFSTVATPKATELIASPTRHGGSKEVAETHFRDGFASFYEGLKHIVRPDIPFTIYYAFKQTEESSDANGNNGKVSTGWETMLQGLIDAGFQVTGTYPVRTTKKARSVARDANALASAIVIVCRSRHAIANDITRRDAINAIKAEMPESLRNLQRANIAPVDLAQASIGPGMAVFSRYSRIINADGSSMTVREALQIVNQVLDEVLSEQESDFDPDTRWALKWFEQYGHEEGPFGDAEILAKAMAVSVQGVVQSGIAKSGVGKVRLLRRNELDEAWDPQTDERLTLWEATQHLIRSLDDSGENGAAALLKRLGVGVGETARELAYRLYQICEHKKWTDQGLSYNSLIVSWPEIEKLSQEIQETPKPTQSEFKYEQ